MSAGGDAPTSPCPQSVTAPPPPEMVKEVVKEEEETERALSAPENVPVELIMTLALDFSMAGSEG